MSKILIVDHRVAALALASLLLEERGGDTVTIRPCSVAEYSPWALKLPADDPFCGGGRSKGDKKRAARERRMRGGF